MASHTSHRKHVWRPRPAATWRSRQLYATFVRPPSKNTVSMLPRRRSKFQRTWSLLHCSQDSHLDCKTSPPLFYGNTPLQIQDLPPLSVKRTWPACPEFRAASPVLGLQMEATSEANKFMKRQGPPWMLHCMPSPRSTHESHSRGPSPSGIRIALGVHGSTLQRRQIDETGKGHECISDEAGQLLLSCPALHCQKGVLGMWKGYAPGDPSGTPAQSPPRNPRDPGCCACTVARSRPGCSPLSAPCS